MKKNVLGAILAAAVPAALAAQADCPEATCQVAPCFAGNGGFVGTSSGSASRSQMAPGNPFPVD